MRLEIERKFLATPDVLTHCRDGVRILQGYLHTDEENTIRVRRIGERAFLTWKGRKQGAARHEYEREIAPEAADRLFSDLPDARRLEKTRFRVEHAGMLWDIDVFDGPLTGLILAEVELEREDQTVPLPPWVIAEVTSDERYRNSKLTGLTVPPRLFAAQQTPRVQGLLFLRPNQKCPL
ncbi:CYTH domain-containing protein [Methylobacterium nodulans]|uniref:Adenylate cyclase n=1 Tax=Methylobacterium nodulans (strain LMG 21967 / CNCM I-2342 / ORS 2060) TaxID=460265 RepID=B8IY25_METNO|nr:CYTH domain-containing protein [Methylobacterium nodulans]ACL63315.1 adenylate cyclase [Methylobacterium nodulans ORS 2060]